MSQKIYYEKLNNYNLGNEIKNTEIKTGNLIAFQLGFFSFLHINFPLFQFSQLNP